MPGFWRTLTATVRGSGGTTNDHARRRRLCIESWRASIGHTTQLRVFVDPDLLQYDEVWATAGTWNDSFGVAPADIVRVAGGVITELKRA